MRSAIPAANRLPERGPNGVDVAPVIKNLMMMMMIKSSATNRGGAGKILIDHKGFVLYVIRMFWETSSITCLNGISSKDVDKHMLEGIIYNILQYNKVPTITVLDEC